MGLSIDIVHMSNLEGIGGTYVWPVNIGLNSF